MNPYHPRAGGTCPPAQLPEQRQIAAAKRREASLITPDGQTIYKMMTGEWQRAYWNEAEAAYSSWWRMGYESPPLKVVVL